MLSKFLLFAYVLEVLLEFKIYMYIVTYFLGSSYYHLFLNLIAFDFAKKSSLLMSLLMNDLYLRLCFISDTSNDLPYLHYKWLCTDFFLTISRIIFELNLLLLLKFFIVVWSLNFSNNYFLLPSMLSSSFNSY